MSPDLADDQRVSIPSHARLRARRVKCGFSGCHSCPHGPYYYAIWQADGKRHERYLGKKPPPQLLFKNFYVRVPNIGDHIKIDTVPWTATLGSRPTWQRTMTICRVDGAGWSLMGQDKTKTAWVTLRTQDGIRVYRQSRLRVDPKSIGLEIPPPGDPRWPVAQILPIT